MAGVIAIAIAIALSGCVARAKNFKAPDATKMNVAAKRLSDAVTASSATAERAATHIEAAQKAAEKEASESVSIINLVNELAGLVPPELKEKVAQLQGSVDRQQVAVGEVVAHVAGARHEHELLRVENKEVIAAKEDLGAKQVQYVKEAGALAVVATRSDKARYEAQSQLAQQKILKWVFRIGGGALVLGLIALFVTGKISIKAARAYFRI